MDVKWRTLAASGLVAEQPGDLGRVMSAVKGVESEGFREAELLLVLRMEARPPGNRTRESAR
jgi:hypothetical protein